jgi:hypothetical protein
MDEDQPRTTSKFAYHRDDLFYNVLTPYIVGLEPESVLIDVTEIMNVQNLKTFFGDLNTDDKYPFYGVVFLLYYRMYSTFVYILQPRAAVKYHCLLTNQPTTGIDC